MKIIFSRKGFDSGAGGVASPILPDDTMLSLPIPDPQSPIRYDQIRLHGHNIGRIVQDLTKGRMKADSGAHLDPDLEPNVLDRKNGWQPIFGQAGADQTVLEREGVGPGDIFLFFGWFRRAEKQDGVYQFAPKACNIHAIWGWMQVERVIKVEGGAVPSWANYHPHVAAPEGRKKNTLYTGCAGKFMRFHQGLQLTAPGCNRSLWSLPGWIFPEKAEPLGYHADRERWTREGDRTLLKTVARGQEFVLDVQHYPEAIEWLENALPQGTADICQ